MTKKDRIKHLITKWFSWNSAWRHVAWEAVSPAGKHMHNNTAYSIKQKRLDALVSKVAKISREDML